MANFGNPRYNVTLHLLQSKFLEHNYMYHVTAVFHCILVHTHKHRVNSLFTWHIYSSDPCLNKNCINGEKLHYNMYVHSLSNNETQVHLVQHLYGATKPTIPENTGIGVLISGLNIGSCKFKFI